MENPIKHYYSISNIILNPKSLMISEQVSKVSNNEFQINFYAGDYLQANTKSFKKLNKSVRKSILSDLRFFIQCRIMHERIDHLANPATYSNFIGYSFGKEDSDCNRFVFLFFQNRIEVLELRGTDYEENYSGIVQHRYEKYLDTLRDNAIFINHLRMPTYYHH